MRATFLVIHLAWLAWLAAACDGSDNEACPADGARNDVTGQIVEGEVPAGTPLTFPLKIVTTVSSQRPVRSVTIGGQPARLTDTSQQIQRWEASLFLVDLERNATPGSDQAVLDVVVTDLCGATTTIDQATFALDAVPGVVVSELATTWVKNRTDQCAIPSDGRDPAVIKVTAAATSLGGIVTLQTSQGTFANGDPKQDVTLRKVGDASEASTFLKPATGGVAVVTASARQDTAGPLVLVVTDEPAVIGPDGDLRRGISYGATFTSTGNFARCDVEEAVAGASTVTFVEPAVPVTNGSASVAITPVTCGVLERVRATLSFGASAPDGATVTLRCFDDDGRFKAKTFRVENLPPPMP